MKTKEEKLVKTKEEKLVKTKHKEEKWHETECGPN
jgi:hypothetical protein